MRMDIRDHQGGNRVDSFMPCFKSVRRRSYTIFVKNDVMGDEEKEGQIIVKTGHFDGGFCARHFEGEKRQVHNCTVMKNVGHDHTLIF